MVQRKDVQKLLKRKVGLRVHPDKLPGNSRAEENFKKIGAVSNKLNKLPETYNLSYKQLGQYISDNAVEVIQRRGITDLPDWYVEHLKHRKAAPRPQPAPRPRPQPAPQPAPRPRARTPSPPKTPTMNEMKIEVQSVLDSYYSLPNYNPRTNVFKTKPVDRYGTFRLKAKFLNSYKIHFADIRMHEVYGPKKVLVLGPENNYREPFVITNLTTYPFKRYGGNLSTIAVAVDINNNFYYMLDKFIQNPITKQKKNKFVDDMKHFIALEKADAKKKANKKMEKNKEMANKAKVKANAKEKAKAEKAKAKANAKEKAKAEKAKAEAKPKPKAKAKGENAKKVSPAKAKAQSPEDVKTPSPVSVERMQLLSDVNRLLRKFRSSPKYDIYNDVLFEGAGHTSWMTKHYLRPAQVNNILRGNVKRMLIIEPQTYDHIQVLDKNHMNISGVGDVHKKVGFVKPTYFYKDSESGLAVTGSGKDHYIVVTPKFKEDFEKYLKKEKISLNKTPSPKAKTPTPPPKANRPGSAGPPGICKCRCKKGLTKGKTTKTGTSYYFMKSGKKMYCGQAYGVMSRQCEKYC